MDCFPSTTFAAASTSRGGIDTSVSTLHTLRRRPADCSRDFRAAVTSTRWVGVSDFRSSRQPIRNRSPFSHSFAISTLSPRATNRIDGWHDETAARPAAAAAVSCLSVSRHAKATMHEPAKQDSQRTAVATRLETTDTLYPAKLAKNGSCATAQGQKDRRAGRRGSLSPG